MDCNVTQSPMRCPGHLIAECELMHAIMYIVHVHVHVYVHVCAYAYMMHAIYMYMYMYS